MSPNGEPHAPKPSPLVGEGCAETGTVAERRRKGVPVVATVGNARALRRNLTDAETKLWRGLRAGQIGGAKFRRQVPMGPYVADFLCYDARVLVEVDGGQHAASARDAVRDRWFAQQGFRVLRFWNNEVLQNLDGVLTVVADAVAGSAGRSDRGGDR